MTKQYPIISLNNEMYMIDKEANVNNIKEGDWFIRKNQLFQSIGRPDNKDFAGYYNPDFCYIDFDCFKILASTDKSLNLPLLPAVEEKTNLDILKEHCNILLKGNENINEDWVKPFITGVNAVLARINCLRTSTKEYTKADIEAAVAFGVILERFRSTRTLSDEEEFKGFLEGLKPKPIAIEVEMQDLCGTTNTEHTIFCSSCGVVNSWENCKKHYQIPKVDENNFIKPIKWIYE